MAFMSLCIDLDGERVDTTAVEVEVHPAVLNVFYDYFE